MALTPDAARRIARDVLEGSHSEASAGGEGGGWEPAAAGAVHRLGRFIITGRLGSGGMGEVVRAQQESPSREVALKLIKPELVSPEVRRRFEHEARALGRLQHPGIAQIFDAGEAETELGSLPYFAMELVEGRPLTQHAQEKELPLRARLELFLKVCAAVEHAHRKGIVHRDLKPSNILVTAAGEPKILDFGVARITDADVQLTTIRTDLGKLIGTIPYMSPEQAAGEPDEVDTRSDVYSLGVVLYELLTGRLPYELGKRPIPEAVRVVREVEPAPLSSINRSLRGDLDTIVAKALEKERQRRYQSVGELAADIRRYLNDEAIIARPASVIYQVRKFARRNRGVVSATLAGTVVVAGLFVATVVFAVRESVARQHAESLRLLELDARMEAEAREKDAAREATNARAVSEFVQRMFTAAKPENMGRDLRVMDMLQTASGAVGREFDDHPETAIMLRNLIGQAYLSMGEYAAAEQEIREAEKLASLVPLTSMHADATRGTLAVLLFHQGRIAEADAVFRSQIEASQARSDRSPAEHFKLLTNYVPLLLTLGRMDEAARCVEEAKMIAAANGLDDVRQIGSLSEHQARLLVARGRFAEAAEIFSELAEAYEQELGRHHLLTVHALDGTAHALLHGGRAAEAVPIFKQVVELYPQLAGDAGISRHAAEGGLAQGLRELGNASEAEVHARRAWEALKAEVGEQHPAALAVANTLSLVLQDLRRHGEAEELLRRMIDLAVETLGEQSPRIATYRNNLALALGAQGRDEEAVPLLERVLEWRTQALGPNHPSTRMARKNLARTLRVLQRLPEAVEHFTELIETLEVNTPQAEVEWIGLRAERGIWLRILERYEEAEAELLAVARLSEERFGAADPRAGECRRLVRDLYNAWGFPEKAAAYMGPPATQPAAESDSD